MITFAAISTISAELSPISAELSPIPAELSPISAELSPIPAALARSLGHSARLHDRRSLRYSLNIIKHC